MMTDKYWQTQDGQTSLGKYLQMNEQEKDIEIQKAIVRLQRRIKEIMYILESDGSRAAGPASEKKNGQTAL